MFFSETDPLQRSSTLSVDIESVIFLRKARMRIWGQGFACVQLRDPV